METTTCTTYTATLRDILGAVILNGTATYTEGGTRITGGTYDADSDIVTLTGDGGRLIHSGASYRFVSVEVVV